MFKPNATGIKLAAKYLYIKSYVMKQIFYFTLLTFLYSSKLFADCAIQNTTLPITCEETAALLQILPSQHEKISAQSQVDNIRTTPIFSQNRELESIAIELEFSPFYQESHFSSFVYAHCYSDGITKTEWRCTTTVRNQFLSPVRQLKIKFDQDISQEDATEILSIIDESTELWPQKCPTDNVSYFAPYIHSVSYHGENFEVSFCNTATSKSSLFIGRDMNNLKLFPITVKNNLPID